LGAEKLEKEMGKQDRTMMESNYISMAKTDARKARTARVVIVGGGFGGLAAAKALRNPPGWSESFSRTHDHSHTVNARFSTYNAVAIFDLPDESQRNGDIR
jgi:hypothetical protein